MTETPLMIHPDHLDKVVDLLKAAFETVIEDSDPQQSLEHW